MKDPKKIADFENKTAIVVEMAEHYGWHLHHKNPDNGQLHLKKDEINMHLWTTSMTARVMKQEKSVSFYKQAMQDVELLLHYPEHFLKQATVKRVRTIKIEKRNKYKLKRSCKKK